jgi:hypothetical protein
MILKSGYGLLHKKENVMLGFSTEEANSCDSVGTIYTLSYCDEPLWIVKDKLNASYVRLYSTEWYNAGYEHPMNPYKPDELEVVKIEMNVTIEEPYPIPTFEEYMNLRYNTPGKRSYDPEHCKWVLSEHKKGMPYGIYSLYDLRDTLGIYGDEYDK